MIGSVYVFIKALFAGYRVSTHIAKRMAGAGLPVGAREHVGALVMTLQNTWIDIWDMLVDNLLLFLTVVLWSTWRAIAGADITPSPAEVAASGILGSFFIHKGALIISAIIALLFFWNDLSLISNVRVATATYFVYEYFGKIGMKDAASCLRTALYREGKCPAVDIDGKCLRELGEGLKKIIEDRCLRREVSLQLCDSLERCIKGRERSLRNMFRLSFCAEKRFIDRIKCSIWFIISSVPAILLALIA